MNASRVAGALAVACILGAAVWTLWPRRAMPEGSLGPVAAEHPERLSRELAQKIDEAAQRVRSSWQDSRAHAELGLVYEANGLWSEARECYDRATRLDPSEVLWPLHAALCTEQMGEPEAAEARLSRAAELFPKSAPLQHRLAETLLAAGDFDRALASFGRLVELLPEAVEGWVGLGAARLKRGEPAAAVEPLERAILLDANYRLAHYLLGLAYRDSGRAGEARRELELGRDAYRRLLGDAWSDRLGGAAVGLEASFERALGLLKVGRLPEAAAALEKLHRQHPRDIKTLGNLGITYARMGRPEEGLAVLDRALEVDPNAAQVHMTRASCLLSMGRAMDALAAAERSVSLAPHAAANQLVLGMVLRALGRDGEARSAFLEARRLDPGNQDVARELSRLEER